MLFSLFVCSSHLWGQTWEPSWNSTINKAEQQTKKILLVFSGSDWCIPCIKLENEVWISSEFQTFANDNLILYRADFPKRKKNKLPQDLVLENNRLAQKYNPNGYFPWVLVLSSSEKVLGTFSYKKQTVSAYVKKINSL